MSQTSQKAPKKSKPVLSRTPVVVAIIGTAGLIIAAIVTGLLERGSTPSSTSNSNGATNTVSSPTPTSTPVPQSTHQALYEANFSQGDNSWLNNSNSAQWRYDNVSTVLTNNGKPPKGNVFDLVAPYQPTTANYAVEAEIQVVTTPPAGAFFGIFVRSNVPGIKEYDSYILDNTYSEPGLVGLVDNSCQINVRSFTIFPL